MLFILAEKHNQEKAYIRALRGTVRHPNRYVDEVDRSKTLPKYPKIQLSYLQGHAYELVGKSSYYDPKWKSWALKYLPVFPKKLKHHLSKKFNGGRFHRQAIDEAIINNHAKLWLGSDPDVEGEGLIYEFTDLNGLDKYIDGRIWITHGLTPSGLIKTFHNDILDPAKTRPRATASHAREAADWLIGINISRLATDIAHKYGYHQGGYNAGRVQSPTLMLIAKRRKARAEFKPSTSYQLAFLDNNGAQFLGKQKGDDCKLARAMFKTADDVKAKAQSLAVAPKVQSVSDKVKHQTAPRLPKTSDMQGYIIKHARVSAKYAADKVLEPMYDEYSAQTYPRTECNLIGVDDFDALKAKLPQYKALYEKIIGRKLPNGLFTNLKPRRKYVDFTGKKIQKQGHGAITPNPENKVMSYAQYEKLNTPDKVDYKHVLGRTLAMFASDHAYQQLKVTAKAGDYTFSASNKAGVKGGHDWKDLFPWMHEKAGKAISADDYYKGDRLQPNAKYVAERGYYPKPRTTTPPTAITEANLVDTVMPKHKLGTSSTRDSIIDSLKHSKLVRSASRKDTSENLKKNEFMPTDKGVIDLELLKYSHLMNLAKVASWQDQMSAIAEKKLSYNDFLKNVKQAIVDDIHKMPQHDYQFSIKPKAPKKSVFSNIKKQTIGIVCPKCKKHKLTYLTMDKAVNGKPVKIGFYGCPARSCGFSVNGTLSHKEITPDVLQEILDGKLPMQELTSKAGRPFKATFRYSRGKIRYVFPSRIQKTFDITCPKCHKGKLGFISGKSKRGYHYAMYVCTRQSCNFAQSQKLAGVKLTPAMIKEAIQGRFPATRFTSRKGKPFSARLTYTGGKNLSMKFDD